MRSQVIEADCNQKFTPDLIEKMRLVSVLWQQHFNDFFEFNVHPHTNTVIAKHES